MCISGCHIIFWGDKTIKFGVNVIQRHSSKRQRYEPSSEKTWSTLRWLQRYDELRQRIEMICIITKNVVCCRELYMCLRDFQLFPWWIVYIFSKSFLFWRNVLMKHSDVELWTAEMSFQCNVRLMNDIRRWIFCYWMNSFVKTFILLRREVLLLQRLLMEHFSSSVHHLLRLQPDWRTFIISSLVLTMKTSASRLLLKLWIVIDNISSQLTETV